MQERFNEIFDEIDVNFKIKNNIIYIRSYDMFNLLYYLKGEDFLANHRRIIKEELNNFDNDEFEKESLIFFKDVYISLNSFINNIDIFESKHKNKMYIWIIKILLEHITDNSNINLKYNAEKSTFFEIF